MSVEQVLPSGRILTAGTWIGTEECLQRDDQRRKVRLDSIQEDLLIASIEQPAVIEKILSHQGMWATSAHSPRAESLAA